MNKITKLLSIVVLVCIVQTSKAQEYYGILFNDLEVNSNNANNIFGDGLASYIPAENTLVLRDGFDYHLSRGYVNITTQNNFTIRLEGDAEITAAVKSEDNISIEASEDCILKITSNISGSALKCPNLTIGSGVTLDLLSRNSSNDMHALECNGNLIVNEAILLAEVTTARLAVKAQSMTLNGCWLAKPKGGRINPVEGGICYADGIAAKIVKITTIGYGIDENTGDGSANTVKKVFENGQIVIIKDGKKYNIAGQEF